MTKAPRTGKDDDMAGDIAEKRDMLLAYERLVANRLAHRVLEKPKPPLWMIFIPIFFVFFAMKMKEYKNGLKNFAADWMITRELALDVAYDAVESGNKPGIDAILAEAREIRPEVLPYYRKWVEALVDHFCHLLQVETVNGGRVEELMRRHYRTKSSYQLMLRHLGRLEQDYLQALLPTLPGDQTELRATVDRIRNAAKSLQPELVESIF